MPLDLSALEEMCALLVPAYGITGDARAFREGLEASRCVGPYSGPDDTYGILRRDDWRLQPRATVQFLFSASALWNDAVGPIGERRIIRLREADEPMPDGLANVCMMVEGSRICARRQPDRTDLHRGHAAWGRHADARINWISNRTLSDPHAGIGCTKTVWFGRSGMGALVAPVGNGRERILLIDFHIADREAGAPDLLFVWASCTEVGTGGLPHLDPRGDRFGDDWHALVSRARSGLLPDDGP